MTINNEIKKDRILILCDGLFIERTNVKGQSAHLNYRGNNHFRSVNLSGVHIMEAFVLWISDPPASPHHRQCLQSRTIGMTPAPSPPSCSSECLQLLTFPGEHHSRHSPPLLLLMHCLHFPASVACSCKNSGQPEGSAEPHPSSSGLRPAAPLRPSAWPPNSQFHKSICSGKFLPRTSS
jgi:hypothetical protein